MSEQPGLFAEAQADLASREAWGTIRAVPQSACGRYTIVWDGEERYTAYRRNLDERGRYSPPSVLGGFTSGELAREACAHHAATTP